MPDQDKKVLGKIDLLALSVGAVVGAGVITVVGPGLALTGRSIWFAYFCALIFGVIINIPFFFVGSALRLKGGLYSMVANLGGDMAGGMFAVGFIAKMLIFGTFGKTLGIYVNSIFPALDSRWVGIAAITLFYLLNLFGLDAIAKFQKLMTALLIVGLMVLVVGGIPHLNPVVFNFSSPEFFTAGPMGFIKAIFFLSYSTTAYYFTLNYGNSAKNATRDIPWAMAMTIPILVVLYCGTALVNAGTLPLADVVNQPLTIVAKTYLSRPLFVLFIVGGPIMAITTTLNAQFFSFSVPFVRATKEGWFPAWFGKTNSKGIPYIITSVMYLIGITPLLLNFNIKMIIDNTLLVTYTLMFFSYYAIWFLPKKFPEEWKRSTLHVGNQAFYSLMILSILAEFGVIVYAINALTPMVVGVSLVAIAACVLYAYFRYKSGKVKVTISVEGASIEEAKATAK